MCGLTAVLSLVDQVSDLRPIVEAMTATLHHRGPDAQGHWCEGRIGLGHARLSILDLSEAGSQPMPSRDGRWMLVFNGEIYNHLEIRESLPGPWRGHSDTETLVEAIATWGVKETLRRCRGMFAIAAWDRQAAELWLARDGMGEKPLYYGRIDGRFCAASELKAILAGASTKPDVDRGSLCLLLRHNYIPAPHTIWSGISKLLPGQILRVDAEGRAGEPEPFWQLRPLCDQEPSGVDDPDAIGRLDALLREVVAGQMLSDVPLGAFLSGGVDSSLIVALMQAQSSRPIRTFTIGFAERDYDESAHSAAVARHLGTEHTSWRVSPADVLSVIPELPQIWDEPFSDSSQVPTLILSRLTRKFVTVSLSGDAGDELFAGYNRYTLLTRLRRSQRLVPAWIRRGVAGCITTVPPGVWDAMPLPGARRVGDKAHKLAGILSAVDTDELYRGLVSHWPDPASVVIGGREWPTALNDGRGSGIADDLDRIQFLDQVSYLPDDILVKVDRAAMAASLETRVPFLDPRVITFAWSLPHRMRIRDGQGKWLLRRVLDRYVPRQLIDRPKMGFGIPLDAWLRGPLRDWAESLLDEDRLRREGFFHPAPIRRKWTEHLSGRRNWQYHLWDILMFQAWHERWIGS